MPVVSVRVVYFIWPHSSRNTITYVISVNQLSLTGLGSLANYYPYSLWPSQYIVALFCAGALNYSLLCLISSYLLRICSKIYCVIIEMTDHIKIKSELKLLHNLCWRRQRKNPTILELIYRQLTSNLGGQSGKSR